MISFTNRIRGSGHLFHTNTHTHTQIIIRPRHSVNKINNKRTNGRRQMEGEKKKGICYSVPLTVKE
jgi:hypothetical protein